MEVARKLEEVGLKPHTISIPENSRSCVECHQKSSPGIIDHWKGSTHAVKGVGCVECHKADSADADAFDHYGETIATIVTPRDCSRCHKTEYEEFSNSHHARAGKILGSLDNILAEEVEGSREPFEMFNPHASPTDMTVKKVNGLASVNVGCKQCHGSTVTLEAVSGDPITVKDLKPDKDGKPTNADAVRRIRKDGNGQPIFDSGSWPNTGIGRVNLDGSLGSCSACHSRHDFSPRRARQPENCGKCHLGPDHPQKEIFEESKHGVAYRDLKQHMNLDAKTWVLGIDYTQAPTCATCHMSAHTRNGRKVTHNAGSRISWSNRPPVSVLRDTTKEGEVVLETKDLKKRRALIADTWQQKRTRMKNVCAHCHTPNYINGFYKQYDDFITN
ncbi:MAG: hydroxylamine oxidoreductase, partial [Planctomycetes bacterium]|nr:hydroxylamine oxidoreductase [Planctomycetota bacterium]